MPASVTKCMIIWFLIYGTDDHAELTDNI